MGLSYRIRIAELLISLVHGRSAALGCSKNYPEVSEYLQIYNFGKLQRVSPEVYSIEENSVKPVKLTNTGAVGFCSMED